MPRYDEFLEMQAQETDDCILWPYARSKGGYGQAWKDGKVRYLHVLSCTTANGSRPFDRAEAAHSCGVRACFNPRHLRWATRKENAGDRVEHGTELRGEKSKDAKLTEFDVRAIRHYVRCGTKQQVLADHFGVQNPAISNIVTGKTWGWLV